MNHSQNFWQHNNKKIILLNLVTSIPFFAAFLFLGTRKENKCEFYIYM